MSGLTGPDGALPHNEVRRRGRVRNPGDAPLPTFWRCRLRPHRSRHLSCSRCHIHVFLLHLNFSSANFIEQSDRAVHFTARSFQ